MTFGDKWELVLWELVLIDQLPTYGASQHTTGMSEVMRCFDDFLDKISGGPVGEDSGTDGEGRRNRNDQADGRRRGGEEEGPEKVPVQVNGIIHEAGDVESVHDDSDFMQFYDPEYGGR